MSILFYFEPFEKICKRNSRPGGMAVSESLLLGFYLYRKRLMLIFGVFSKGTSTVSTWAILL